MYVPICILLTSVYLTLLKWIRMILQCKYNTFDIQLFPWQRIQGGISTAWYAQTESPVDGEVTTISKDFQVNNEQNYWHKFRFVSY